MAFLEDFLVKKKKRKEKKRKKKEKERKKEKRKPPGRPFQNVLGWTVLNDLGYLREGEGGWKIKSGVFSRPSPGENGPSPPQTIQNLDPPPKLSGGGIVEVGWG